MDPPINDVVVVVVVFAANASSHACELSTIIRGKAGLAGKKAPRYVVRERVP